MEDNKPRIVPPAAAAAPAVAPTDSSKPVLTVELTVPAAPTIHQILQLHAQVAEFLNQFVAECLRSKVVSAGTPTTQGAMQASAALEQSALQVQMNLQQRQQAMMPQQGGPPPGMPPYRMN